MELQFNIVPGIRSLKGAARINYLVNTLLVSHRFIADENHIYLWNEVYYEFCPPIAFKKEIKRVYDSLWDNYTDRYGLQALINLQTEVFQEVFHQPGHIIPFKNGVFNLETNEFETTALDQYHFTNVLPFEYSEDTDCPLFHFALQTMLPEPMDRQKVMQYMRYCLNTSINQQYAQIWVGSGSNGKTALAEFLIGLLGNTATSFDLGQFAKETGYKTILKNKNVAVCSEIGGVYLTTAAQERLKGLITDKYHDGRAAYEKKTKWINTTKFLFTTNLLATIQGRPGKAFWRRWEIVWFLVDFTGKEDKTIFEEILQFEGGAVLTYLLKHIQPTKKKANWEEIQKYWLNASSSVLRFTSAECVLRKGERVLSNDLYAAYSDYMNAEEDSIELVSMKVFTNDLRRNGVIKYRANDNLYYFKGLMMDYRNNEQKAIDRILASDIEISEEFL